MRKMIRSVCFFWSERSVPPGKSREPISELQPKYPLQIFHVNLKKDAFLENLQKWKTLEVADSMYPCFVRDGLFSTILDFWTSKISRPYYAISKPFNINNPECMKQLHILNRIRSPSDAFFWRGCLILSDFRLLKLQNEPPAELNFPS